MKKVLITGQNGYIGTQLKNWLSNWSDEYNTEFISLKNEDWRNKKLGEFDVVVHLAGLAHVSTKQKFEKKYYKINKELTIELAEKCKSDGVKHFIFMSSIIVFGDSTNEIKSITKNTVPIPSNFYGDSKLQAEKYINLLESPLFKVSIIRPPMVYGKGSKGNFIKLLNISNYLLFLPNINNKKSVIYIDNLTELIRLIIKKQSSGIFMPRNLENVSTTEIVKEIRKANGKKTYVLNFLNQSLLKKVFKNKFFNKIMGSLYYDDFQKEEIKNYRVVTFEDSIKHIVEFEKRRLK